MSLIERELKLQICDILDHFLNMRQNFLQTNLLAFFKNIITKAPNNETKDDKLKENLMLA